MTGRYLDWRERKALQHCAAGFVQEPASFSNGVGPKTLDGLVAKGWLVEATCETYGTVGYKVTEAGRRALYGE